MLPSEIVQQVRRVQLHTGRQVVDVLAGAYLSVFKGGGVEFDEVVTAEQVGCYKPSLKNFQVAFERLGHGPDGILHVAQSLYHDIAPARALGLRNVWVNRRAEKKGPGATSGATAKPDLEVPDLMALSSLMGLDSP